MQYDNSETDTILMKIAQGESPALERLLDAHRGYMRRLVELRMDQELRARVDPSDIVQETSMVVSRRINDFVSRRPCSFRVWLRSTTLAQIIDARRHHLAKKRSVHREFRLSDASSMSIAQQLMAGRPSQIAQRKELAEQVRSAVDQLNDIDREIILLRHIEELTNTEAAEVLQIEASTARKRHGRALRRLVQLMTETGIDIDQ